MLNITNYSKWKWSRSVVSDSLQPQWTVAYQAPPSIHGIFQARALEGVAISLSISLSTNYKIRFLIN